jgi:hypothetical protein
MKESLGEAELDDDWSDALIALRGSRGPADVKPMAMLLKRGGPVPEEVAKELGILLDPPWGNKGPRLILRNPDRWNKWKAIHEIGKKRALRERMLREYAETGSKKRVIHKFAQETQNSKAYLLKCWELTVRETVRQLDLTLEEGVGARTTRKRPLR